MGESVCDAKGTRANVNFGRCIPLRYGVTLRYVRSDLFRRSVPKRGQLELWSVVLSRPWRRKRGSLRR